MSRFLKKIVLIICFICFAIVMSIMCILANNFILLVIMYLVIVLFIINIYIYEKNRKGVRELTASGKLRNVDYLIIGDLCNYKTIIPEGATYYEVCSPKKSTNATYEILKHTFSILKDNGKVIIVCNDSKHLSEKFTVFDTPYFNSISIKRLGLKKLKRKEKLPLIFEPIKSIQFLFRNLYISNVIQEIIPNNSDIETFCRIRELDIMFIKGKNERKNK